MKGLEEAKVMKEVVDASAMEGEARGGADGGAPPGSGTPLHTDTRSHIFSGCGEYEDDCSCSSQTAEEKIQDEKKLELLLRSDFIDDGHLEMPINSIKQESLNGFALDNAVPSTALNRGTLADLCTDPNLPEIGQLLFFQLPDSLPGLQLPADTSQKEAANSIVKVEEHQSHNGLIKLSQFPEGYVGKLQVMKSGRVRLVLGAVSLSVDTGTHLSFHQELTSMRLSEDGEADFSVLGHVLHKLICLPDMEQLLAANSQEIS
ncbi:hypothetical protein MTO96_009774 [Rhipicephalus appendiculatus]